MVQRTNTRKHLVSIAKGFGCSSLLSVNADAKTVKGQKIGILTGVMYLMPNDRLCPMSTIAGCRKPCLVSAGRARFTPGIGVARAGRTAFFEKDKDNFMRLLVKDIQALVKRANKLGLVPAIRLNGTSDINWSNVTLDGKTVFEMFPDIQFYDYTKSPSIIRAAAGESNWHITASYSEASEKYRDLIVAAATKYGANLAVVFRKEKPATFMGRPVLDGDTSDVRFYDERNSIVGLKAKGGAKRDTSGFVIDPNIIAKG